MTAPKVLIDTNIVSYMMRGQTEAQAFAKGLQGNLLAISFVMVGELFLLDENKPLFQEEMILLRIAW